MSDSNSSGGAQTAIVALVALAVVGALVWFFAFRGDAAIPDGPDLDVDIELPDGE